MFCSNCGSEAYGKFCSECGHEVDIKVEPGTNTENGRAKEGDDFNTEKKIFSLESLKNIDSSNIKDVAILAKDKFVNAMSEKMEQKKEQRKFDKQEKKENKIADKQHQKERMKELKQNKVAYCPKCKSTSLSANTKGYGVGKGIIGASLVNNPIGLVAGNLGSKEVKVTCLNCGYKFHPGQKIYL